MKLFEAKQILKNAGFKLLKESTPLYKIIINKLTGILGSEENIKKKIDEYINLTSPKAAYDFKHDDILPYLTQLINNKNCTQVLNIPNSVVNKFRLAEKNFNKLYYTFLKTDEEILSRVKKEKIELIENTIDTIYNDNNEMQKLVNKIAFLKPEPIIPHDFFNGEYTFKKDIERVEKYDIWDKIWVSDAGKTVPTRINVTYEDLKNYLDEYPDLYDAPCSVMVSEFSIKNGVDTQSIKLKKDGIVSVGNPEAINRCKNSEECQEYINWRKEHNSTWYIPLDEILPALKAFKEYPKTLSSAELDAYQKNVKSYHDMAADIADYYAHARYTGD